ncbi:MAG: D-alanine--D-alanine ligase [Nocardioidaceae bacterium]|nr:D-alanine--D-alanine ligase [Nocardioidaceae bacterium]
MSTPDAADEALTPPSQTAVDGRTRVAVVFGGRSPEHGVSCLTAADVIAAIDPARYDVIPIGIAADGRWVLESTDAARFRISDGRLPEVDATGTEIALRSSQRAELVVHEPGAIPRTLGDVDVVFPLLHGPWGEDGTLQGLLEMAAVRYVGAGVLASAVGMDKEFMKLTFAAAGLPQLPYAVVRPAQWEHDRAAVREAVDSLGYPVFVKPARAGSSFGISRVEAAGDVEQAIEHARRFDPKVLVEAAALQAREVECGVLEGIDGGRPEASVVGEIRLHPSAQHTFYDFEAKYVDGTASLEAPADLPDALGEQLRHWAVRAFEAIGGEGLARVDFFVLGHNRAVVNEINTMPGFTPTSMFPRAWAASGLDYPGLVDRLITAALQRGTGLR